MDEMEKKNNIKEVVEWIICIVIAVVLALLVRHFVFTPTVVKQMSMEPTFMQNDRLILNRLCITFNQEFEKGDIITFEAPSITETKPAQYDPENPIAVYENEPTNIFSKFTYNVLEIGKESYIKRIIAVGGDTLLIEDGAVYVNGEKISEEYLPEGTTTERTGLYYDLTVPEGYVFAMGDNRSYSKDCRSFGCIPIDKIESKVVYRFWPFSKMGKVS